MSAIVLDEYPSTLYKGEVVKGRVLLDCMDVMAGWYIIDIEAIGFTPNHTTMGSVLKYDILCSFKKDSYENKSIPFDITIDSDTCRFAKRLYICILHAKSLKDDGLDMNKCRKITSNSFEFKPDVIMKVGGEKL